MLTNRNYPHQAHLFKGPPTAKNVRLVRKWGMANAASQPTHLGGGQHGHLGMVMTNLEFMNQVPAPGAAYDNHVARPGVLQIPAGAGAVAIKNAEAMQKHQEIARSPANQVKKLKCQFLLTGPW